MIISRTISNHDSHLQTGFIRLNTLITFLKNRRSIDLINFERYPCQNLPQQSLSPAAQNSGERLEVFLPQMVLKYTN